jgi:antitoxin VapB
MSTNAKLFMSGRSQAMRLPAKLRLQAQEVRIEQIGDALWLQHFYATSEPLPPDFLADRVEAAPQARDWG